MINCFVLVFFGILISTLSLLQIINRKKGFEKDTKSYETLISFLKKNPWLALVFGLFFAVLGMLFFVGSMFCFFESETLNKCFWFLLAGFLISTVSFFVIINYKRAFEGYIKFLSNRIDFWRNHSGLALFQSIFFEALGILLIIAGTYCFLSQ